MRKNRKDDIEESNLYINVTIFALTAGLLYLNRRNVALNAENVRLNRQNVINNKSSAESGRKTLEVLKEINNKL